MKSLKLRLEEKIGRRENKKEERRQKTNKVNISKRPGEKSKVEQRRSKQANMRTTKRTKDRKMSRLNEKIKVRIGWKGMRNMR